MPMNDLSAMVNQNFMVNDGQDFDDQILQQVIAQSMKEFEESNPSNQEE